MPSGKLARLILGDQDMVCQGSLWHAFSGSLNVGHNPLNGRDLKRHAVLSHRMAPYVPQWYAALGTQESRYILYKVDGGAPRALREEAGACEGVLGPHAISGPVSARLGNASDR